ncbi:hypothetical protein TNCV_838141 [Trichonephila clavipes]|nr:hypothetical protein TNCV_838141 [Trichonephila clavipes]
MEGYNLPTSLISGMIRVENFGRVEGAFSTHHCFLGSLKCNRCFRPDTSCSQPTTISPYGRGEVKMPITGPLNALNKAEVTAAVLRNMVQYL